MKQSQILLLQACLLEPKKAFEAYQIWQAQTDFEKISTPEFNLLPILYLNLQTQLNTDLIPRLKGVYRQAWVQQQHRTMIERQLLELCQARNLPVQVHDNAAVNLLAATDLELHDCFAEFLLQVPREWWFYSQRQYQHYWQTRGFVLFRHSIRVFRQILNPMWLHRLKYASHDLIWLARHINELQAIQSWDIPFQIAAQHGLRKRLYAALKAGQLAQLLEITVLPMQFSDYDQAEFQRSKSQSRLIKAYYALQVARLRTWEQRRRQK